MHDLKSQRFGRLFVICPTEKRTKDRKLIWLCQCDCGNLTEIIGRLLLNGHTKSCGCLWKEWRANNNPNFKHGDTVNRKIPRLYNIWLNMKARCYKRNHQKYKNYGNRGIFVFLEWKNSYQTFKKWALASGYADNLTIDRIDNDGSYIPDNCQWITRSENSSKPKHKNVK